jgi:II/X family phage/plasmid replication protein
MLDWLTLKTDITNLVPATLERLQQGQSRIFCVDSDGSVQWEKTGRDSVRSDSHQLTMELGSSLVLYGSPARIGSGRTDNVFGSGDPVDCASRMIGFLSEVRGVELPPLELWNCTRMDVTHNYDLGELANVRTALEMLRHVEGGRYQVRTSAETVYWSVRSTRRSGKAYSKGEHLAYLMKRGDIELTDAELSAAGRLLRLELSLKRHFFARAIRCPWWQLTEADLNQQHETYFGGLVGKVEISEMTDIREACIQASVRLGMTEGQGRACYLSWNTIRAVGFAAWRSDASKATFYRHKKILREAGLSYADFNARNVVPIRRRSIVLGQPVRSWSELLKAA